MECSLMTTMDNNNKFRAIYTENGNDKNSNAIECEVFVICRCPRQFIPPTHAIYFGFEFIQKITLVRFTASGYTLLHLFQHIDDASSFCSGHIWIVSQHIRDLFESLALLIVHFGLHGDGDRSR